jgi:hypothetical protein
LIKSLCRKFAMRIAHHVFFALGIIFADFLQHFMDWSSPYKTLAMLVDHNFKYTSRPGGAGNQ